MAESAAAVQAAVAAGAVRAADVTPELLAAHLYTRVTPLAASALCEWPRRAAAQARTRAARGGPARRAWRKWCSERSIVGCSMAQDGGHQAPAHAG